MQKIISVKNVRRASTFSLCSALSLFLSACGTSNATQQPNGIGSKPAAHTTITSTPTFIGESNDEVSATGRDPVSKVPIHANDLKIPANFSAYASESIGNGEICVVGTSTDDDGMNQKPIAYVTGTDKHPIWIKQLDLPADIYQGRATHCSGSEGTLLVLVQFDTQAVQTMSQTFLRVVKLDAMTGIVRKKHDLNIPSAYTAWVNEGSNHFEWKAHVLAVSGSYRTGSDPNHSAPFIVHLDNNLNQ